MTDNPKKRGRQDRAKVSVSEAHELRHWCAKFGCTQRELREAVDAVGHSAKKVGALLAARPRPAPPPATAQEPVDGQ
jgi:hypothetical protein